jgi:hypothetical protein
VRSMAGRISSVVGAVVLGAVSALVAPMVMGTQTEAGALDYSPCANAQIEQAIFSATGEHTGQVSGAGLACNPFLYNKARWSNASELQNHVTEVLNRCGNTTQGRLLVLALLETTGIPPQAGVANYDNVCHHAVYEQWWADTASYNSPGVNWDAYVGGAYPANDVYGAVSGVMSVCNSSAVSHAVVSVIDRYPVTNPAGVDPNLHVTSNLGVRGQCDPGLYRNGVWSGYDDLKQRVVDRAYSQPTCIDDNVQAAYQNLTGWQPLASECDVKRYGNGSWSSYQELVNRVYHSWRCSEPWLGQFFAYDIPQPRQVRGRGYATGECNTLLYRKFDSVFLSYEDFRSKVRASLGQLQSQGATIEADGDVNVGGKEYDGKGVLVGSTSAGAPQAGTLGGQLFSSQDGSSVIVKPNTAAPIISTYGGGVISTGGGNIISDNGGGLIGQAGGNLIGQAGGN